MAHNYQLLLDWITTKSLHGKHHNYCKLKNKIRQHIFIHYTMVHWFLCLVEVEAGRYLNTNPAINKFCFCTHIIKYLNNNNNNFIVPWMAFINRFYCTYYYYYYRFKFLHVCLGHVYVTIAEIIEKSITQKYGNTFT